MKTYYKDFTGATASITEHRDGSATLQISAGVRKTKKTYASKRSALAAWRRCCA